MENNTSKKQNNQVIYKIYDDNAFTNENDTDLPERPIVENMFYSCEKSAIIGDTQTGKSFCALYFAYILSTEHESLLGNKICYPNNPVLYFACESFLSIKKRYRALVKHFGEHSKISFYNYCYDDYAENGSFNLNVLNGVIKQWKEKNPTGQMIFIDTLSASRLISKENDNDETATFLAKIDKINKENQTHICFIQHTSKANKENSRGASSFLDNIDFALLFQKENNVRNFSCMKIKDGIPFDKQTFSIESEIIPVKIQTAKGIEIIEKSIGYFNLITSDNNFNSFKRDKKQESIKLFAMAYYVAERNNKLNKDKSLSKHILNDFTKKIKVNNKSFVANFWTKDKQSNGFDLLNKDKNFVFNDDNFYVVANTELDKMINFYRENGDDFYNNFMKNNSYDLQWGFIC